MNSCSVATEEREKRWDRQKRRETWTDDGWEARQVAVVEKKGKEYKKRKYSAFQNFAPYNSCRLFYTFKPALVEERNFCMEGRGERERGSK